VNDNDLVAAGFSFDALRDARGPLVTELSRQGFGQRLLTEMTAQVLSGKAILDYAKDRVEWRIECPTKAVLTRLC